jgi:UDP-N-acetylglucosamine 2-epimerase (non-hydrolysing)
VTGNTAIDALNITVSDDYSYEYLDWVGNSLLIHRRENLGESMGNMFKAIY